MHALTTPPPRSRARVPAPVAAATAGVLLAACLALPACGGGPASLVPADYAAWVEVRNCRGSADHDLRHVRVLVLPELADIYRTGPYPFPAGALVLKEEHEDAACTSLVAWSVMRKEAAGYFPSGNDWHFQHVKLGGKTRTVDQDGKLDRCAGCHLQASCRDRDGMCANEVGMP